MRTAPAVRLVVRHQGMWHATVWVCVLSAATVGAAWVAQLGDAVPGWGRIALIAALLACLAAAASAAQVPPTLLRWDGQVWQVGPAAGGDAVARTGSLAAVIDVGPWMLLRFDADRDPAGGRARRVWLPVQRRGLEAQWHAVRCAVHAPRSSSPSPSPSPSSLAS